MVVQLSTVRRKQFGTYCRNVALEACMKATCKFCLDESTTFLPGPIPLVLEQDTPTCGRINPRERFSVILHSDKFVNHTECPICFGADLG